jgi:DNA polymerase III psi subunit
MTESTESTLTYPEHHAAWLEAMGVTRWQAKRPLVMAAESQTITENFAENRIALNSDSEPSTDNLTTSSVLSPQIEMADYWVVAQQPLNPAEAYLLAGMMQAIHAKAVVFSHPADELLHSVMQTGLASWPRLVVQGLPFAESFVVPKNVKVLFLGEQLFEHKAQSWCLPTLAELLSEPMRKRDAWEVLKQAKSAVLSNI